jgi:hypothetical protein
MSDKGEYVVCRDLLKYDLSKPEDMEAVMESGLIFDFCPKVTKGGLKLLEEIR